MAKRLDPGLRDVLKTIPQKFIREACGGRQVAHLQRMEARWGCPLSGATTDLNALLGWLWGFLVQHGPMLKVLLEDEGGEGENSLGVQYLKAKISKTRADAKAAELRNEIKEGRLCDREVIHQSLVTLSERIRRTSDTAIRRWGNDAADMFEQLANGFGDDLETMFGDDKQPAGDAVLTSQPK